jgi:hypothetical protein
MVSRIPRNANMTRRWVKLVAVMYSCFTSFWIFMSLVMFLRGHTDLGFIYGALSLLWLWLAAVHWRRLRQGNYVEAAGAAPVRQDSD